MAPRIAALALVPVIRLASPLIAALAVAPSPRFVVGALLVLVLVVVGCSLVLEPPRPRAPWLDCSIMYLIH